jgi:DNA-binding MarR family transcriptional regulator
LLDKHYIVRVVNTHNRRENVLTVTPKGERLLTAAEEAMRHHAAKALLPIDEKRQKALQAELQQIHDSLCASKECSHRTSLV